MTEESGAHQEDVIVNALRHAHNRHIDAAPTALFVNGICCLRSSQCAFVVTLLETSHIGQKSAAAAKPHSMRHSRTCP